jgi:hypothetical protein
VSTPTTDTGLTVEWPDDIPGVVRCHLSDPVGNGIELVEAE